MIALLFLDGGQWPVLLLLAAMVACALVLQRRHARARRAMLGVRADAVAGAPVWLRTRAVCGALALLACGVAWLRPVGVGDEASDGADVALCIDVSWSMAARDQQPSRLGAVQRAIDAFVASPQASHTRLALCLFAGDAVLRVPLTHDAAALAFLANDLVPGAHGLGGTDPAAAIAVAQRALPAGRGAAIVVCSDGEDFPGNGPAAAAAAQAAGIAVHVLACGDEAGSKIPVATAAGEVFLVDGDGKEIVSRCERDHLAAIARAGGGRVVVADERALLDLHASTLLPAARAAAVRDGRLQPVALQHWPLCVAWLLWMLSAWLPERRR